MDPRNHRDSRPFELSRRLLLHRRWACQLRLPCGHARRQSHWRYRCRRRRCCRCCRRCCRCCRRCCLRCSCGRGPCRNGPAADVAARPRGGLPLAALRRRAVAAPSSAGQVSHLRFRNQPLHGGNRRLLVGPPLQQLRVDVCLPGLFLRRLVGLGVAKPIGFADSCSCCLGLCVVAWYPLELPASSAAKGALA